MAAPNSSRTPGGTAPDREKALDSALGQIERQFGKGSVMRLGSEGRAPIEVIPTGSIALDVALGIGGLPRGRVVEIYGPEASGKCLTADALVPTNWGLLTVGEIFEKCGQNPSCTSRITDVAHLGLRVVNEVGISEPVTALTHNNRKPVLRVTSSTGKSVRVTANHPMRVLNERGFIVWRNASALSPGDVLVGVLASDPDVKDQITEREALLLGYLVGDGHYSRSSGVMFSQVDTQTRAEFVELMGELFPEVSPAVYAARPNDSWFRSTAARTILAERYGLEPATAPHKRVPRTVRESGHLVHRAFLSALFECDGCVEGDTVTLSTASDRLAVEVQVMLAGLGLVSSIRSKKVAAYPDRTYWTVALGNASSIRFVDEVGFRSARRAAQCTTLHQVGRDAVRHVPHMREVVRDLRDAVGGDREFDRIAGDLFRDFGEGYGDLAATPERLARIVDWARGHGLGDHALVTHLEQLTKRAATYEAVVSIEPAGDEPTFDLVVPGSHSFVANGLAVHNTTLALHAIANAQASGGIAALIDAEHALDPDYAKALGVDIDALLVSQPDNGEQALEIADMLIRSGALDLVVIDSVAALVPKAEIEGEMGDSHVGLQARLMSQALRKITGALSNSGTTAIFINQLREKIGVFFGSPETTTGGKALKFYASVRLDVRRIETLKDGTDAVGNRTRVKVVKNKCLAAGSRIYDPVTGITHRIEDVVEGRLPIHVVAMDKKGQLAPSPVTSWFDQGEQPVVRVTLRGGPQITVTPDHKLWTERGWVMAGSLKPGDRVARPRRFGSSGDKKPFTDSEARLLGYLIGDGYVGGKTPVTLTCTAQEVQDDARRTAESLGCIAHPQPGHQVQFSHRPGERNGVLALARAAGIHGKLAWEKTLPPQVFDPELSEGTAAHLMVGLLETDGYVSREQTGAIRVGYSTTSEQLAHQVAALLLRLGVTASVRRYDPTSQRPSIIAGREVRGRRDMFEVRVGGAEQVARLAEVLPHVGPRSRVLAEFVQSASGRYRGSQQVYLPEVLRDEVLGRIRARGATTREVAVMLGRPAADGSSGLQQLLGTPRLRRDRVQTVADALDDAVLRELLSEDVAYAAVRSVEPAGQAPTYDLEVDEFHTFVADGIVVHNCASPFKQAEFDMLYGQGISREGGLIDLGVEQGLVRKSGAWYTYEGDQLGQGKENARTFLKDNPDLANEIEKRILEKLGIGAQLDAEADADLDVDLAEPAPIDL